MDTIDMTAPVAGVSRLASNTPLTPGPRMPEVSKQLRRNQIAWKAAGIAVIVATSIALVVMWASTATGHATDSAGGALVLGGRLTGLLAANLMLYQVILLARVPLFERAFGHDALVSSHRPLGIASFVMLALHIVLIGMAKGPDSFTGGGLSSRGLSGQIPGMSPAVLGVWFLIAVAVTTAIGRKRMRYETWHRVHKLSYVAVVLSLPHQFLVGTTFTTSVIAATYWWSLWTVAMVSILVFRVIVPRFRSKRSDLRVDNVTRDGNGGVTVVMTGRNLNMLKTKAGQFFVWQFKQARGWSSGNPFSISATPVDDQLQFTARVVGDGTRALVSLAKGTRVRIEGPYGRMVGDQRRASKLLMLGAGAGVGPLVAILQEQDYAPGDAVLVTRNSQADEQMLVASIHQLAAERGVHYVPMVGDRAASGSRWLPAGFGGSGVEELRRLAPDALEYDVFLCGPSVWMKSVMEDLVRLGVPRSHIHSEDF